MCPACLAAFVTLHSTPSKQPFFYDFIGSRLRVDSFALIGLGELNSSSYWLGDSLYIYDFGIVKSCQLLNMTFGEGLGLLQVHSHRP